MFAVASLFPATDRFPIVKWLDSHVHHLRVLTRWRTVPYLANSAEKLTFSLRPKTGCEPSFSASAGYAYLGLMAIRVSSLTALNHATLFAIVAIHAPRGAAQLNCQIADCTSASRPAEYITPVVLSSLFIMLIHVRVTKDIDAAVKGDPCNGGTDDKIGPVRACQHDNDAC